MIEKFLGCPFCGADASTHTYTTESLFSHDQVEYLTIQCDDCDFFMTSEQQDELRERWNSRALPTPASAERSE